MKSKSLVKVGLFGIGLDTYWEQFDGLKENLLGYQTRVRERLADFGADVIDVGLVDNPAQSLEIEKLGSLLGIETLVVC